MLVFLHTLVLGSFYQSTHYRYNNYKYPGSSLCCYDPPCLGEHRGKVKETQPILCNGKQNEVHVHDDAALSFKLKSIKEKDCARVKRAVGYQVREHESIQCKNNNSPNYE